MKKESNKGVRPYSFQKKLLMELKIAVFIVLVSVTNIFATDTYSQMAKVSLDLENKTLEQVMDEIERQSEFYFIFNQKQIDVHRKVTVHENNILIDKVLDDIFKGTDVYYAVLDRKILLATEPLEEEAQAISLAAEMLQTAIRGTVTDSQTGEPMPGVNVQVKGTTIGAMADPNGMYTLPATVAPDATLIFSFIGYQTLEVAVQGRQVIDVKLVSDVTGLDEVVVIGYGTQKKETLTGSVAAIDNEAIQSTKSTSVASAIQGKIPGVMIRQRTAEPGTFSSLISVRGFGEPLLVIDGVVRDDMADFERLNPDDIENISILKDASAAIYGMNADNGVVIVTTKKGQAGKTKFNFSTLLTVKQPTTTTLQQSVDAYTYRVMRNEMSLNTGSNANGTQYFSDSEIEKWRAGTEPGYQDYDWYNEMILDWCTSQQYNFSMQGGGDKVTFYTSFGYLNDNGLLKGNINRYDKFNFRTNVTAQVAKGLTAKISFAGKYDNQNQPYRTYFWQFKSIITADRGYGPYAIGTTDHYSIVPPENNNILAQQTEETSGYRRSIDTQYQTTVDINYELPFLKGLTAGLLLAYDGSITDQPVLNKSYYVYDYMTDIPRDPGLTTYSETLTEFRRQVLNAKLGYRNTFNGAHNVSGTLVFEARHMLTNYLTASRQYDDVYTHDIINQGSLTNLSNGGSRTEEAFMAYIGRLNYDYKGKYLVEFTFREDGSYRYAPGKRWAFFPAGSIGWRMSEEPFIKNNLPVISNLKLRASYGLMGADAGSAFQYYEGYTFSSVSGGYVFNEGVLTLGMIPPGVVNDNLSWINTSTADIGIDVDLWKGKLGFTFDVFQKNRDGMLSTRVSAVPNTFGASFPQENLNSDVFKGMDMEVRHRNQIGKFEYNISANVTYSRRWLLHVEQSPYQSTMAEWLSSSDGGYRIQNTRWIFFNDGQYQNLEEIAEAPLIGGSNGNSRMLPGNQIVRDVDGNGIINYSDRLPESWSGVGTNPPLQYGMTASGAWNGLDVSLALQGSALFTVETRWYDIWGYGQMPTLWDKYMDRWHTEDPDADRWDPETVWIPGKYGPLQTTSTGSTMGYSTDKWIFNATYLRIKSLEVGYTIPTNITKKFAVEGLRAFINVFNLYTFCGEDVRGMDPERDEGMFAADLTYPLLRSFSFGLNVNF